jgi:hypothetical protein
MKALQKLSQNMPVADQKTAQGLKAARDIQLRSAIGQQPTTAGIQQARQMGAAAAAQAGQQAIAQAQQGVQQQQQLGQLGIGEAGMQQQQELFQQQMTGAQHREALAGKIAKLSEEATQEVFDSRMQFQRDEMNRLHLNERQLADFAVMQAESEEEFRNWEQTSRHAHKRKLQVLETLHKKTLAEMEAQYKKDKYYADRKHGQELKAMEKALRDKIEREKREAANKAGMWGAAGTAVGAGVGAYFGQAQGAKAGAEVGGSLGQAGAANT